MNPMAYPLSVYTAACSDLEGHSCILKLESNKAAGCNIQSILAQAQPLQSIVLQYFQSQSLVLGVHHHASDQMLSAKAAMQGER